MPDYQKTARLSRHNDFNQFQFMIFFKSSNKGKIKFNPFFMTVIISTHHTTKISIFKNCKNYEVKHCKNAYWHFLQVQKSAP